ncbi:FHA domain-containing protein, partial [Streptomyces sp. NPDC006324]|uniref:FHA domain-containing protein n=1 Tax=Streptomyces sp. NPDC006324 TaxID=3156751 RepID=UPI0033A3E232
MGERPAASAAPDLVLEIDGDATLMDPSRVYRIGRDPASDIVLSDARASWHHAVLSASAGRWTLTDEDSTNGTFADGRNADRRPVRHHVRGAEGTLHAQGVVRLQRPERTG